MWMKYRKQIIVTWWTIMDPDVSAASTQHPPFPGRSFRYLGGLQLPNIPIRFSKLTPGFKFEEPGYRHPLGCFGSGIHTLTLPCDAKKSSCFHLRDPFQVPVSCHGFKFEPQLFYPPNWATTTAPYQWCINFIASRYIFCELIPNLGSPQKISPGRYQPPFTQHFWGNMLAFHVWSI